MSCFIVTFKWRLNFTAITYMYLTFTSKASLKRTINRRPKVQIFAFKAQALFTWIKPNESHPMHRTVIFGMRGKCTLLKSVLSRQVLDSKFETYPQSSIIKTQDSILESFENWVLSLENRYPSDCKLTFEQHWRWVVEQDFHGNFQVSVTWFSLVSLTELCSFWYGLKNLFTLHKFSWHTKLSLTIKTVDITSGRRDVDPHGQLWAAHRKIGQTTSFLKKCTFNNIIIDLIDLYIVFQDYSSPSTRPQTAWL